MGIGMESSLAAVGWAKRVDLAHRTANVMTSVAEHLKPTLEHKGQKFGAKELNLVADLIRRLEVPVSIDRGVWTVLHSAAYYFQRNLANLGKCKEGALELENELFLLAQPEQIKSIIAHEAVHIYSDFIKYRTSTLANEELAYFVEGFVATRMDEAETKKAVSVHGDTRFLLIGCFASDQVDFGPSTSTISSKEFKGTASFDYTSYSGTKAENVNAYQLLESFVAEKYPVTKCFKNAGFDGI